LRTTSEESPPPCSVTDLLHRWSQGDGPALDLLAPIIYQELRSQSAVDAQCRTCLGNAPERVSAAITWGLGIGLSSTPSGRSFSPLGSNGDFKAFVTGSAISRRGVVIFTNSASGMMIIDEALKAYEKGPPLNEDELNRLLELNPNNPSALENLIP